MILALAAGAGFAVLRDEPAAEPQGLTPPVTAPSGEDWRTRSDAADRSATP